MRRLLSSSYHICQANSCCCYFCCGLAAQQCVVHIQKALQRLPLMVVKHVAIDDTLAMLLGWNATI